VLTAIEGGVLLMLFAGFLYYVYQQLKTEPGTGGETAPSLSNTRIWIYIVIGLGGLVGGGQLVVDNAVKIATFLGMSEKLVGLTIVAAGTSLPELATSVVAATKKNVDIAVGNIIGSNIFNLLLVLGLSAVVNPLEYTSAFHFDIALLAGGTAFLFIAMFTGQRKKLDRWEAFILLAVFLVYTTNMIITSA
jgi:cation:H+ antiporter